MRYKRKVLEEKRKEQAQRRGPTSPEAFDPNVLAPKAKWHNIVLSNKRRRNEPPSPGEGTMVNREFGQQTLEGERRMGTKRPRLFSW